MEAVTTYDQAFFGWLLQTTLIASLVICLILLIQKLLGGRLGPRWSYALWLVLLVRMILPWSPSSRVSLSNLIPSWQRQIQSQQLPGTIEEQEVSPLEQAAESPEAIASQEAESEIAAQEQAAQRPRMVANAEAQSRPRLASIRRVLPILWLAGAIVIGMYLLLSDLALWRIVKRDSPLVNQPMLELFEECKAQMGVQSLVVVVPSDQVRSPGLFGFVRPRLLLPRQMLDGATAEEMRYVFLHELAHLRRHDIYLGWLISLLQVLHWFNPLVWFAFYRMRTDRELACDALVLSRTGQDKSQEYGGAIVELVRRFSRSRPLPAMAGIIESKSQLKRRIAMITKFRNKSYRWSPLAVILIVILACISLPDATSIKASVTSTSNSAAHISIRRVWAGSDVAVEGEVSPDGRYISYTDWDTGDLAVYEVATGNKRRLTNKGTWDESDEFAEFSRWSPDSKQIVYDWYNKDRFIELRIVGLDGSEPRILYRNKDVTWAQTYDWSHDGKQILACFSTKDGDQIALVSVADSSVRFLKTVNMDYLAMVLSPDGRYIVYERPQKESSPESDIFLLSADGSREIPLVEHPADDRVLDWTPDGKNILFTSDRTGSLCMWSIAVADGRVQGIPKLIRKDIGQQFTSMGFTKEGSFYYGYGGGGGYDVYTTKLDLQTGKVLSPPKKAILRFEGHNATPDYSPDGKYMAYVSHRGSRHQILCIRSLETGQEQEFPSKLMRMTEPKWSPDGNSILIAGMDYNINRYGQYQVDLKTGIFMPVLPASKGFALYCHEWSSDGKSFFLSRTSRKDRQTQIILREIKSGKEKEIYHLPRLERFRLACSPDGQWLAFINMRNYSALRIIPSAGGEPRELYRCEPKKEQLLTCKWSADGKYILFVIRKIEQKESNLWRIPVEGGEAQKIDLGINIGGLSIHPDGQHIAFGSRENQPAEVWVMKNFLPEAPVAKPDHQTNFRKILIPTQPGSGILSPDGEKLAFISEGSVWVIPVHGKVSPDISGEPVRLTKPMGAWDVASFVAWSANGKWIAFNVSDEKEDAIYVIRSSGGVPMKVPVKPRLRNSGYNYRLSLSPDGKVVAFSSRYIDKSGVEPPEEPGLPPSVRGFYIYTVPVAGGNVKRLTDSASGEPAFSPDGKKIAFVKYYTSKEGELCGGLWVVPAAGGSPIKVDDTDIQRQAGGPIWSPDGKKIAFTSRTSQEERRKEICIVPLSASGKALANPTKIDLPLTTNDILAGWTPDNKIGIFLHNPDPWAIYTVPTSGGHAVQVTTTGWATHPQWSPDGQRIYFRWNGGSIASVPSDGGKSSIVRIHRDSPVGLCYPGSGNAVSPDGKQIVFSDGISIYTVPVEGGESKEVTQGRYPCWSPDGKSIAFIRTYQRPVKTESRWNIYIVSLKGGDVRQLTSEPDNIRRTHIDWSPDGKSIAYFAKDKTLRTIPVQGGESRIVATAEELENHDELAWSPDGSKLVYSSKGSIWVVSSDGGEPEEIRTGLDADAGHVSWSPDGNKLAFTAIKGGEEELYLIENFLTAAPFVKTEGASEPTLRRIEVRGRGRVHSQPSFDGRYMSDVDDTGNVVIRELATGKERSLTKKDNWPESKDWAHRSLISPDGTKVAYSWFNAETEDFDLRVVGFDGSDDRLLWGSEEGARSFNMGAWSPDGRYIFGKFFGQNDQLMRISTEDGSRQIIRTFDGKGLSKVDVSSDGRYVAYAVAGKTTSNRDIFVFDLETNEETPLVEHPANDKLLGWTPDGQHIFFASDRNGTWDGWLVQIVDGKPDGIPEVVKPGIGNIVPVGFTRNGSFYYEFQHEAWNVYTTALDSNTGQVTSDPEPLRHVGRDIRPDWSPDGRYIAYLSEIDRSKPQMIRIRTLATGRERELKIDIPRFDWLRWCPDSRHLLITSFNRGSPSVVYRLDAKTGEYNTLVKSDEQRIRQAELSADGKTLAYRTRGLGNANRLIVRDMETGSEKELLRTDVMDAAYLSPFAGGWTLSPDGKQVALSVREGEGDEPLKPLVLKVLSITSGELKTLVGAPVGELAWTRDGSSLLFVKDLAELWCVSAKGVETRRLWKWKQMIWGPRIDPDGQRIAFHSGGNVSEMWVMENFLPEEMGK